MADEDNEQQQKPKGSMLTKVLLFGILPLMTATVLVFGGLFVAGVLPVTPSDPQPVAVSEEDLDEAADAPLQPAIYLPIDPAFVVNFASQGKARFLQVTVEVMTREPLVVEDIKLHMPVIRNNLVLLFSSQSYDTVSTLEGKEALRGEALRVIQDILEEETGDYGVEAVYFTSFVMQ